MQSTDDYATFGDLVAEYLRALPFALDFQDVHHELEDLEAEYGPPGGAALLGLADGVAVGCVALRPFSPPLIAELKRMYVRPRARGAGAGTTLAKAALEVAGQLGYARVRLDTVAEMLEAGRIYERLGFRPTGAYRHNPLPTARFYEVALGSRTGPVA